MIQIVVEMIQIVVKMIQIVVEIQIAVDRGRYGRNLVFRGNGANINGDNNHQC